MSTVLNLLYILSLTSFTIFPINGAGFDYPDSMSPPIDVPLDILQAFFINVGNFPLLETPIATRWSYSIRITFWNCLAIYHPTALDFLTAQRPRIVVDDDTINQFGTSETRAICASYAVSITSGYISQSSSDEGFAYLFNEWGLDASIAGKINDEVLNCGIDDVDCLQNVAEMNGFVPEVIASIVGYEIVEFLRNDGWNQDGTISPDGSECTANCRRFGDTTNYVPKVNNKKRWQPLVEDNGYGFFYHYDHVTPHIGFTADVRVFDRVELESKLSPNPKYDYQYESELVVDRMKDLATNDTMKMLVEWLDNKGNIEDAAFLRLNDLLNWSFEESVFYYVGYEAAQYTAVVQSWLEKRRYDLVRPTTWIKENMKDDIIETYGGPGKGLKEIKGKDFESYFRVMPHSEYPSGSGCICKSVQQFVDKYLQQRYGIMDSVEITVQFAAGSSFIEQGVTPSEDLEITFKSMTELSEICGESRLWGGMHYTASVPAAQELCDGIGIKTFEYMNSLLNGEPL